MRLVWTDEEFADEFAKTIVEKYDRGEHISPDDVLRRIKEKPEYDEVVELSEKLGILPPDSLKDRLSKRTPPRYPAATQYADAARQRMAAAVNAFVAEVTAFWEQKADPDFEWLTAENDKRRDLHAALHCDVGLGKTHITQREVQAFIKSAKRKEIPHRVLWLVPHHALSRETLAGFEYADVSVAVWRGREADDPNNVRTDGSLAPMCLDNSAIRDAQVAGADPDKTVCGSLDGKHCPFLPTCSYKKQRDVCQNADVVIAAHNVLFMPLVKSVMKNIGLVVVDEGFWSKGVHADRDINLLSLANDVVLSPVMDNSGSCNSSDTGWLEHMCVKLQKAGLATADGDFLGGDLAGISADDAQRAAKMEFKRRLEPHMWPGMAPIDRRTERERVGINGTLARRAAMWKVVHGLLEGDAQCAGRLQRITRSEKSGATPMLTLRSRDAIASRIAALPVLMLDATFHMEVVKQWFPRVRPISPNIRAMTPNMTIYQILAQKKEGVPTGGFGKTSLIPDPKAKPAENQRRQNRVDAMRSFVKLRTVGKTGLVITYQDLENQFKGIPGVATAHFNAITGLDKFGTCDSLFVIGRPLPPDQETRRLALAIFGRAIPAETTETRHVGVLHDGLMPTRIEQRTFTNPDLEAIRWLITDAEVIQSIGRGRGVNRNARNQLRVYLLSEVPVPYAVDSVEAWGSVRPDAIDEMWLAGGIAWSPADAAALYPELFPSDEAARKSLLRASIRTNPYESPYREMSGCSCAHALINYQLPGAGQHRREATVPAHRVPEFIARLEALHGSIMIIPPDDTQPGDPTP